MRFLATSVVRCRNRLLFLVMTFTAAAAKPGFFLTTHNSIIPGSKHNVCITFVNVTTEVIVEYEFTRPQQSLYDNLYAGGIARFSAEGGCKEFAMPVRLPEGFMELSVNGYSSERQPDSYAFNGTTILKVVHRTPEFTLIQTDKPVYKPGQTVRIRLVTLLFNLSVVATGAMNILIKNPDGIDIERWDAVPRSTGIVDLHLQLAEEPRIGTYVIHCDADGTREQKNFTVLQYVLPRVEVKHKPAEYFVRDIAFLQGEVCASYTFLEGISTPSLKGLLTASFSVVKVVNDSHVRGVNGQPFTITDEINGCYLYNVSARRLKVDWYSATLDDFRILASVQVVEHGTGIITTASNALIRLHTTNACLSIIGDDSYKPGLPYSFKVKVGDRSSPSHNEQTVKIEILYNDLQVINRTEVTNEDGYAFVTETLPFMFQDFTITAKLMHNISKLVVARETKKVTSWYSPSGRYLKLRVPKDGHALSCNSEQTVDFDYTTTEGGEGIDLNVQVIGKSNILESRRVQVNFVPAESILPWPFQLFFESCTTLGANVSISTRTSRGSDSILLKVTPAMSPSAKLIVFYISPDGEVVADSIELRVKDCTQNAVKMSFSKSIVRPGRAIQVHISAAADSFCTYGVVDRSVDLLSNGKLLDLSDIFEMAQARTPPNDHWLSKLTDYMKHTTQCQSLRLSTNVRDVTFMDLLDSRYSFLMGKTAVLTDVQVDTRKCVCRIKAFSSRGRFYNFVPNNVENEILSDGTTYEPSVLLRDYFPETWLWDAVVIRDSGQAAITVRAPHSMTSWRGAAMCAHSSLGFGISPVALLTTFQRFFMRVRLPNSVIRGESMPVVVKVHNYYEDCFAIRVLIEHSSHFEIIEGSTTLCVCGPRPETVVFRIVPRILGAINVTITAREEDLDRVTNYCPSNATMSKFTGIQDAVVKNVLVEAEGQREEYVQSAYICAKAGEPPRKLTMEFALPQNMVPQSARGTVSVVGDLLGVTLAHLQVLVILPTDCGEQSMVKFAPAVFTVRYLHATGQLGPELQKQVIIQLKAGYQKQVQFIQSDGSFRYYPHSPSNIWLTAYIVKCFAHATRYVPVAADKIATSIAYLRGNQLQDGCYYPNEANRYSRLAPTFTGTSTDILKIRITAFVAISMLEAGVSPQDPAVVSAISCLERPHEPDVYGLTMTAYVFSLHDWQSPRRSRAMRDLWRDCTAVGSEVLGTTGNTKHWMANSEQGIDAPINIEATAYALLAILKEPGKTLEALPVVNWLTRRQNARGGYTSTQDTVVAIQALAAYAEATYSATINNAVVINISTPEFSRSFDVNCRNKLVVQTSELSTLRPGNLTYIMSGAGCAVVQAKAIYNVKSESRPNTYFQTIVRPYFKENVDSSDNCTRRLIQICSRYTGQQGDASAMAIIDIRMISGWTPDIPSLDALYANRTLQLMRYSQKNQQLSLHFLQITKEFLCLTFEVIRTHNIIARPGHVSTYEYYSPAHRHDVEFALEECTEDDSDNSNSMESMSECTDECEAVDVPNSNMDLCPTCSEPRQFSKLCQYTHVLKAQFVNGSITGEDIRILNDFKNRYRPRQPRATAVLPRSCLCEVFDDTNVPFIVSYNNTIYPGRRAPVLHLSSKDIFIFTATRDSEEKTTNALRRCSNQP